MGVELGRTGWVRYLADVLWGLYCFGCLTDMCIACLRFTTVWLANDYC
jgi:hypothetical protein